MLSRKCSWEICRLLSKALKLASYLFLALLVFYIVKRESFIAKLQTGPSTVMMEKALPLHFFALGDTGTGDADQYQVAKAMERECAKLAKVDGIFHLGDIFYPAGVDDIKDKQWQAKVESPYSGPCLGKSPIFPVLGNHDYKGNADAIIAYSQENKRWQMPKRFYEVHFNNLLTVVAFDSNFPDVCLMPEHCAVDFLRESLAKSTSKFKFVLSHSPLESGSSKGFSHQGGLFGYLMKPLICDEIDLWLAGHAHFMEMRQLAGCKTHHIISGGGGGDLYKFAKEEGNKALFQARSFGFVHLEVSENQIRYRFIDANNKVLFEL